MHVEYLDLSISYDPRLEPSIVEAKSLFLQDYDYIVRDPKMGRQCLKINSMDLVHFLGFLDLDDWLDLDRRRFMKQIESQLNQLLIKSLHVDHRYHYRWCLSALKNLPMGRYLTTAEASSE